MRDLPHPNNSPTLKGTIEPPGRQGAAKRAKPRNDLPHRTRRAAQRAQRFEEPPTESPPSMGDLGGRSPNPSPFILLPSLRTLLLDTTRIPAPVKPLATALLEYADYGPVRTSEGDCPMDAAELCYLP